ncbi:MAG: 4-(cytidine 5'-diphospho)-2-C-methyl-D-erythritol kinase [Acetobacteraceae bacterium]|nr:4-(cytidine 5'-diphospho)-2-C-methyl-D-erythritol kinase [Acetobacteraceae bacterium]
MTAAAGLSEIARAKVNLFLHVVGRRDDGYHLLDSLAVFPAVGDVLRAVPADDMRLAVEGRFAAALAGEADNLVLRAARLLAEETGAAAGARLVLEKHLPVASGIGGGSADAAAALRLLSRLWRVRVPAALAVRLGADVPVCLAQAPARMAGVGEDLSPAPALPAFGMVLANPGIAVATPAVFRARAAGGAGFSAPARLPAGWTDAAAMARDLSAIGNDLQDAAVALCPAIGDVLAALEALPGCRLARMSGSGATCFALFDSPAPAAAAAAALSRPGWWVWGGAGG